VKTPITPQFTVCVLLYGNYPELLNRCLDSLSNPEWYPWFNLRIGWQGLGVQSETDLLSHVAKWQTAKLRGTCRDPLEMCLKGHSPFFKYPTMRRMFYEMPIKTPYIMWFDDDSFINTCANGFFRGIQDFMEYGARKRKPDGTLTPADTADMIGAKYVMALRGNQRQYIEDQPWYAGKPIARRPGFITGGWWTIRTPIIQQWNWPSEDLQHNGGDLLLGELCHQQGYRIKHFTKGLGINCDASGRCSTAPRRGHSQDPCGTNYVRPANHRSPNDEWQLSRSRYRRRRE